jgi:hypothetical protein
VQLFLQLPIYRTQLLRNPLAVVVVMVDQTGAVLTDSRRCLRQSLPRVEAEAVMETQVILLDPLVALVVEVQRQVAVFTARVQAHQGKVLRAEQDQQITPVIVTAVLEVALVAWVLTAEAQVVLV